MFSNSLYSYVLEVFHSSPPPQQDSAYRSSASFWQFGEILESPLPFILKLLSFCLTFNHKEQTPPLVWVVCARQIITIMIIITNIYGILSIFLVTCNLSQLFYRVRILLFPFQRWKNEGIEKLLVQVFRLVLNHYIFHKGK